MKRILTPILALMIVMMVGCEKEETTEGANDDCILQKISFTLPDGGAGYDIDFTYDAQERLVEMDRTEFDPAGTYNKSYVIEYGSDGVEKITMRNSQYSGGEIYDFIYTNGVLDNVQFNTWRINKLFYNGDKISRLDIFDFNNAQDDYVLRSQEDVIWNGGNVVQVGDYQYTYDDKPSPLSHIGLAFTNYGLTILSKNNVATVIYAPNGNVRTNTYTYNDEGYPITLDEGYGEGLINYEYSCK